ncbi:hypothetical protein [Segatella copri]|uniref:Uncharacterized protein n=1 Tax=Segatella copri TaxID=165179 RepID=A0AAW5UDC0_9BACT|nr:hypothetical protein [Segatella copri]MCW4110222.1 hypothetical protein [Segatella copri]MCW4120424.1 hypothetical protein [Segatella copri]MCW4154196.1 hypothetical protein [Segatella copri]
MFASHLFERQTITFSSPHPLQFIIPSHHIIQLLLHLIKENAKQIVKDELERIAADKN